MIATSPNQGSANQILDRVSDQITQVVSQNRILVTDFLNDLEASQARQMASLAGVDVYSSQVVLDTERVRLVFLPQGLTLEEDDFELSLLRIDFPSKFGRLTHAQILGTILGETGLDRRKLGDILVTDQVAFVVVAQPFSDLLIASITKIARLAVKLKVVSFDNYPKATSQGEIKQIMVSSLRLDKLLAVSFKLSRKVALSYIDREFVRVNHQVITKNAKAIVPGDQISVRHLGRIIVNHYLGRSKSDKMKYEIEVINARKK